MVVLSIFSTMAPPLSKIVLLQIIYQNLVKVEQCILLMVHHRVLQIVPLKIITQKLHSVQKMVLEVQFILFIIKSVFFKELISFKIGRIIEIEYFIRFYDLLHIFFI